MLTSLSGPLLGQTGRAVLVLSSLFIAGCGSRSELLDFPPGPESTFFANDDAGDAFVPPIDAAVPVDAAVSCGNSPATNVAYLIGQGGGFYSFDPVSLQTVLLVTDACTTGSSPFTMTVTETTAYIMYQDDSIYALDLASLACTPTPFNPSAVGLNGPFGLASGYEGAKEWLYAYGCVSSGSQCLPTLARIDPSTFAIDLVGGVGPLPPDPQSDFPVDMKADGFGRLFAIDFAGTLLEIDPTTARVVGFDATGFQTEAAEALLTWNESIYLIGGEDGEVETFDLSSDALRMLGELYEPFVGAGSAPCLHGGARRLDWEP
jgi:hypothetical protein